MLCEALKNIGVLALLAGIVQQGGNDSSEECLEEWEVMVNQVSGYL